ncbi:MAG: F0F1 ATP synthase subunit B [Phycisphaerales bacterium]|nr:F0F1 ATP synthase subunit B [Phycisphaerales bacterium]
MRLSAFRVSALALALAPSLALASEEGENKAGVLPTIEQGVVPMIVAFLVFAVVFAVLATKVWPTITKGLDERARKITEEIEAAENARKQAKDALEQYQQSLNQARAEAQKMIEQARTQQVALAAELKAKADVELGQMRERAMRDIEAAKRAAITEMYTQQSNLATAVASKILRRELNPGDQAALVQESLRELTSAHN